MEIELGYEGIQMGVVESCTLSRVGPESQDSPTIHLVYSVALPPYHYPWGIS